MIGSSISAQTLNKYNAVVVHVATYFAIKYQYTITKYSKDKMYDELSIHKIFIKKH